MGRVAGRVVLAVVVAAVLLAPLGTGSVGPAAASAAADARSSAAVTAPSPRPSFVVVVMDDASLELVRSMRTLRALQRTGATYDNAFVVNSLCCPSRAATFTGQPPHLNGVRTNTSGGPGPDLGGWPAFRAHRGPQRSYNTALQRSGYRTAFLGKYLNEYEPGRTSTGARTPPPVVPGWDEFESISGEGYNGWGYYRTTTRGAGGPGLRLVHHPRPPESASRAVKDKAYVGTVTQQRATALARRLEKGAGSGTPYLLHVATYASHARIVPAWRNDPVFPAAFRDRPSSANPGGNCGPRRCSRLTLRDLAGYGDDPSDNRPSYLERGKVTRAPAWRRPIGRLSREAALVRYRDRARMVQSVDRTLRGLRRVIGPDTYLIVTSDNGFHLGQHGLNGGKGTPYDSDTRVPLVVTGPGVVAGRRSQYVSNIDLAPTIESLAGKSPARLRAGASFAASLADVDADGAAHTFFEHTQGPVRPGEPDADPGSGGRLDAIPSYVAVRSDRGLLVRLDLDKAPGRTDYAWELYRYRRPWEDTNVFKRQHDKPYVRQLKRQLLAWVDCRPTQCRRLTR
ncbi:sulfatase-like hydrolase/transferase [Nocardioides sp.]|uniref:sulfatase-like hydrolase/transferase n=1 Tax=Nocardioides sp. TaxID=35761 RepID=UPI00321952C9